jgi:hypothetical protein
MGAIETQMAALSFKSLFKKMQIAQMKQMQHGKAEEEILGQDSSGWK